MDEASRAALRRSIEVALDAARIELARQHDELAERRADVDRLARDLAALGSDRARWERRLRDLAGHILTAADMGAMRLRGEAIEARTHDLTRRLAQARAAAARSEQRLEEVRQGVGEALARQRWIDDATHRSREAHERQRSLRDDEE